MEYTGRLHPRPSPIHRQVKDTVRPIDALYRLATRLTQAKSGNSARDLEPDWLAWEDTEIDIRRKVL